MLDNSVDAQYVYDGRRDSFVAVNPAMCELTGYTEEELVSLDFLASDTIHPDDRESVARARERASDLSTQTQRFRLLRKNGVSRWIEVRSRPVQSLGSQVTVGSARDITDQVNLERQLRSRLDTEADRLRESEEKAREVVRSNMRLYQMVKILEAFPKLTALIASLDSIDEVVKQACLYITGHHRERGSLSDKGMGYDRCVIWLLNGEDLEVAYANPFRITTKVSRLKANDSMREVLDAKVELHHGPDNSRLVPIHSQGAIIGVLEVGVSRQAELLAGDDPARAVHDGVIQSLAGFIGIHIANLRLLARVQQQVIEDPLTGLHNRRHFLQRLETEFRRANRYNRALSLLIIDIDHFKNVNDTHSHPQGDVVLQHIGNLLGRSFRDLDSVCRIGGEEIAVIMPETRLSDAAAKAEVVRSMVEALRVPLSASTVPHELDATIGVTVSIGVAGLGKATLEWEQIYHDADRALYAAKRAGRNRVSVAGEGEKPVAAESNDSQSQPQVK